MGNLIHRMIPSLIPLAALSRGGGRGGREQPGQRQGNRSRWDLARGLLILPRYSPSPPSSLLLLLQQTIPMSENESCSLSSESNRGRHAKMTGVEKERDREREGEQPHREQSTQCSGYYPSRSPSLPNICGGWDPVGSSQSRRKEHGKSHLSGASERERLRRRATYWAEGAEGVENSFVVITRHCCGRERERERKRNPRRPSMVVRRLLDRLPLRQETSLHEKSRKHNRNG